MDRDGGGAGVLCGLGVRVGGGARREAREWGDGAGVVVVRGVRGRVRVFWGGGGTFVGGFEARGFGHGFGGGVLDCGGGG